MRADVVARLEQAGCVAADDEADELISAASTPDELDGWVTRRESGEPLAWIIGITTFCGHRVFVDHGVYVPRWVTEVLARRAADRLWAGGRAADLCTGSGAVAVHLMAAARARVVAIDIDPGAVRCARRNGVHAIVGDAGAPLASNSFDVVTAVAPYVPTDALPFLPRDVRTFEPIGALDGGGDGLGIVRRVIGEAARILETGGAVFIELGGGQLDTVAEVLTTNGFDDVESWTDEHGDLRGVSADLVRRAKLAP